MATRYSSKIVYDELVLCLDAVNRKSYPRSGATVYDLSGKANHGTMYNTTWSDVNGGVFVFNGSNTYIGTPLNADANPVSMCAWFYPTDVSSTGGRAVICTDNGGWDKGFEAYGNQWGIHTGDNLITAGTSVANTWYYGCMIYTASSMNLYINTINVYSAGGPGASAGANLEVGRAFYNGGAGSRWFAGNIPFVQVYNKSLTLAEIIQNYNATKGRYGLS
jgi:hypothetical protein